jgi:ribosomal protein L39E
MDKGSSMTTPRFTEEEITARARQLANEQGPGWEAIKAEEQVGKDTAELRYWRKLALKELEAEEPTVSEVEASTPKTVGLD